METDRIENDQIRYKSRRANILRAKVRTILARSEWGLKCDGTYLKFKNTAPTEFTICYNSDIVTENV